MDLIMDTTEILERCARTRRISERSITEFKADSQGLNRSQILSTLAVLTKNYESEPGAIAEIIGYLAHSTDEQSLNLCQRIMDALNSRESSRGAVLSCIKEITTQLQLDTPQFIFYGLREQDLANLVEHLFKLKYYGVIINIPGIEEVGSFNILFRVGQSFGALNRSQDALGIANRIESNHLTQDQRARLILLRATLFHRAGGCEEALRLVSEIDSNEWPLIIAATIYGYAHYIHGSDVDLIKRAMASWDSQRIKPRPFRLSSKASTGPKRVGFISHYFKIHPVGWMTAGLFTQVTNSGQDRFRYHFYDCAPGGDFIAKTLRTNNCRWVDLSEDDSSSRLKKISQDNLDILIDLDGLTNNSAFDVVCARPAKQVGKWVGGLFGSTFNENVDFLISDWFHSPQGYEEYYSERLVRLDQAYATFTPPPYKFYKVEAPYANTKRITFGCFNNAAKLSDTCLHTWSQILGDDSKNRLLLKDKYLDDPFAVELIRTKWIKNGGNPDQLIFSGPSSHENHLKELQERVDICLDPIPYSGGLSTLEAIFLGIPVITLSGKLLCHRHSTSYLSVLELTDLIANTTEEYIAIAKALASDTVLIDRYRADLRGTLLNSALLDHKGFRLDFEQKIPLMAG